MGKRRRNKADPPPRARLSRETRSAIGRAEHRKGMSREDAVFHAFDPLGAVPSWFYSIRRPTHEQDSRGIDVIIESDVGDLYVQVKSSKAAARNFNSHPRRLPIHAVWIHANSSEQQIRDKIVSAAQRVRAQILEKRGGRTRGH